MNGLRHLGEECAGVRSRLRLHVQAAVVHTSAHRLELLGGGVEDAGVGLPTVGPGGDDADHRGSRVDGLGVVSLGREPDGVADAQALLLGEHGVDGDFAGCLGESASAQGGELGKRRDVLRGDLGSDGVAQLLGQVEPQHVPVGAADRGDAVKGGDLVEEVVVQGFFSAFGPTTILDDDSGVAYGHPRAGLRLSAEGVGDDEGEGDEGGAHGHGHEGGDGSPQVEERRHQRASIRGAGPAAGEWAAA